MPTWQVKVSRKTAALKWFEIAVEQGCILSMCNIGYIYENGGDKVAKDVDAAFIWHKKGADGGHQKAQYRAALCFYDGKGTTKDPTAARSWFQKSAVQNDRDAELMLGKMMAKGEGGERDVSQGIALIVKASEQGAEGATEDLESLYEGIDTVQWN